MVGWAPRAGGEDVGFEQFVGESDDWLFVSLTGLGQ